MTTETVKTGLEITELADLKYALWLLECKKRQDQGVVRLLDFAELDGKKWGQSMRLHVTEYGTGKWVLFNPPKQAIRTLAAWNQFLRAELGWTYRILISVAVAE